MCSVEDAEWVWSVPRIGKENEYEGRLSAGDILFTVGQNGTGKSALMSSLYSQRGSRPRVRVHAQRHVDLQHASIQLTPAGASQQANNIETADGQPTSRERDAYAGQRFQIALFRLEVFDREINQRGMNLARAGKLGAVAEYVKNHPTALETVNRLVSDSGMTFKLKNESGVYYASHDNKDWFEINRLSDGERSALLLAADVITAKPGSLILIDEPERHLYRAISGRLLSSLFSDRDDCIFVVSTHDVELIMAMPDQETLLLRDCEFDGGQVKSWDFDILKPGTSLPDDIRRAIIGSRRKILFVEGDINSRDLPMYTALGCDVSVRAVGTSTDVIHAVRSLCKSEDDHWLNAYGLVDQDSREIDGSEIESLKDDGIFALSVYAVEALYYGSDAIDAIAAFQEPSSRKTATCLATDARTRALKNLAEESVKEQLVSLRAYGAIRGLHLKQMPNREDVMSGKVQEIPVTILPVLDDEKVKYDELVAAGDLDGLLRRYKVRSSDAFSRIARALEFARPDQYERRLLELIKSNDKLRRKIRTHVQPLLDVAEI